MNSWENTLPACGLQAMIYPRAAAPSEGRRAGANCSVWAYSISRRYLYAVGLLMPQTLASSLTFILFAAYVG